MKIFPLQREKQESFFNAISEEYDLPKDSKNKQKVDDWVNGLQDDAEYNLTSYAECFISENLIRKYIEENNIQLPDREQKSIKQLREREDNNKTKGNLSIDVRKNNDDLSYLDMDPLAKLVDPQQGGPAGGLTTDAKQYKPVRDALMHTALLSDEAKQKLTSVSDNIKGRIKKLLSTDDNQL